MPVSGCQRLPGSPDAGLILEETHTNSEKTFSLFGTSEKKENASRAGLRANSVPPLRRNTRSGRDGVDDVPLLPCPHRSPDLAPCDFFLWGYVKDKVYVPLMPTTLQALQELITAAVTDMVGNML
ncbi:hypothetical protein AVEN_192758-1 [Araneus ventricosus]|uniref:Uncharacterized protein n=1 Tax=Araneus ventricosus TaxID=182803 RepID=A0A4Y2ER84_ARAVE|nr:hypothetical protein AVEN_192758-1 [Araneus ventricosus]